MSKKLFISANKLLNDSFLLAKNISSTFIPDIIVGLWRGGSIPAISIHEYFNYKGVNVESAVMITKSYTGINEQSEEIYIDISSNVLNKLKNANNILIVDDVIDSGNTIVAVLKYMEKNNVNGNIKTSAIYYKPKYSCILPDYYLYDTDEWIVFPHELEGLMLDELESKNFTFENI